MSYHILLLLAVTGWLTGGPAYSQQPAEEPSAPNEATVAIEGAGPVAVNHVSESGKVADALPALEGIEAALRELVAEQRRQADLGPEEHELRDLHAQEEMVFWAKVMFYTAFASVIITAVGVELVRRTLKASREGVNHANSAANAAWKTVEQAKHATDAAVETTTVTRNIGQRQLRAYVTIDIAKGIILDGGQGLRIQISLKNSGQTPAKNVRSVSEDCILPYRPSKGIVPFPKDDGGVGSSSTIAIGDNLFINKEICLPSIQDLQALLDKNEFIHIIGSVFYDDIFNDPQQTNFFFWIKGSRLIEAIKEHSTEVDKSAFSRGNQWNDIT